jgi:hypothetical protein
MRILHFEKAGVPGIAADDGAGWHGLTEHESAGEDAASRPTEPSITSPATPCSTMRRFAIFNCTRRNGRWARISMRQEHSVPGW